MGASYHPCLRIDEDIIQYNTGRGTDREIDRETDRQRDTQRKG